MATDDDDALAVPPPPATAAPPAATRAAAACARALLLSTAALIVAWALGPLGGVSWSPQRDPETGRVTSTSLLFNWHPVLMSAAFLGCAGEAVLAYRSALPLPLAPARFLSRVGAQTPPQSSVQPPPPSRPARKLAHASLHAAALTLAALGSAAAWRSHMLADPPIPNLYSPHSWLGAAALLLFFGQAASGLIAYLWPGLNPPERRAALGPWHRLLGLCAFFAALAAIATGLQEKATFAQAFGKADVRGSVIRMAAMAEVGVLLSAMAVGLCFALGGLGGNSGGSGNGAVGAGRSSGGLREEEGLLPPRGY